MKKMLLGAFLVLFIVSAHAQDVIRPISAGFKAGANLTHISATQTVNEPDFGFQGGVAVNYRITKKYAVQTEFLYSQKSFGQPKKNVKNTLTYAEMPLLFKRSFFRYTKGGNVAERSRKGNFFLIAGPQLSVLLTSVADIQNTALIPEGSTGKTDLYAYTRPFDISAVTGIGYSMNNGLSVDLRYALGLRNMHGAPNWLVPQNATINSLQVGLSYLMPLR